MCKFMLKYFEDFGPKVHTVSSVIQHPILWGFIWMQSLRQFYQELDKVGLILQHIQCEKQIFS